MEDNYLIRVEGKPFRCPDCGANVFSRPDPKQPDRYQCNGCNSRWIGQGARLNRGIDDKY